MTTVANICDRAARLLSQVNPGETMTTSEYSDALVSLNAMVDSWRNERLMCFAMRDETVTMVSAQTSYTIGPSGNLNTTRPVKIDDAYVVISNISYPDVKILTVEEWDAIPSKTATSNRPDRIYYQPSYPLGTLYVYPIPNAASDLHILTWTPLTAFAAVTDTVSLPPGWEEALATNLAIAISPEYKTQASAAVIKMAVDAKANIKRVNAPLMKAYTELQALVGGRHRSNIITDQP